MKMDTITPLLEKFSIASALHVHRDMHTPLKHHSVEVCWKFPQVERRQMSSYGFPSRAQLD